MFSFFLEHLKNFGYYSFKDTYPALPVMITVSLPDPQLDFKSLESQDLSNLYISYRLSRASQVALVGRTLLPMQET